MTRPLIISDCDEVLLYMVAPFRDWLAETQGVEFRMDGSITARPAKRVARRVRTSPRSICAVNRCSPRISIARIPPATPTPASIAGTKRCRG